MTQNDADEMNPTTQSATDQLRAHSGTVREDLNQLGRLAKGAAREKLGEARDVAGEYYDTGRKKAEEFETQLVDYVRTKPLKSVLIAAGVGALFGLLISRR
jgi:ElaB/YqjD/DUF883 family membrane-anchored ribosome-binding protein